MQEQARRGRPEAGFRAVERRWSSWRGRAVEPLVRESLELAALDGALPWPDAETVGGWWNRRFDPEVDLVGADQGPVAGSVFFAGSVKWLGGAFDGRDMAALREAAGAVPGFVPGESGLVAASLGGVTADGLDLAWGPGDVVGAWRV
ncbi:DUF234 domain-containing protein [Spirillospora albida]|uniref:DUF234 domain-containing protein n=1 Tax=Spirillospora albida TaxID=58123 RepID=UPI00068BF294|nr:DUF234 domain-containing protein [Spirillospora albida]